MVKDKKEKRERNPLIDFSDAVNRSMSFDPGASGNGGCLNLIITLMHFFKNLDLKRRG